MKTIVQVSFDEATGRYHVHAGEGSSVDECVFACSVIARVFTKLKFIASTDEFETMLHKYLTDPQFEEKTEDTAAEEDTTNNEEAEDNA